MRMKAEGNGRPEQCAANLLKIIRGENPYERLKGVSPELIDRPAAIAAPDAAAGIEWVLETYEPRINLDNIDFEEAFENEGQIKINVDIGVFALGAKSV